MKENEAIVAKAPTQLEAILRLSKEINKAYAAAYDLRKKANEAGLALGRKIIEACNDTEIIGRVMSMNAKENKKTGGTPTKIYSYVCDELAEASGYNADYLKQCARNFLNALNKSREQKREKPYELQQGVFSTPPINTPAPEELKQFVKQPAHPRMDDVVPTEGEAASTPPDEIDLIEEKLNGLLKRFTDPTGQPRVNPPAFKVIIKKLTPIIEAHGFAIGKTSKQPVEQRH